MKSILITGCSSGIGRCAADDLQRRGYRVFATARREEDVQNLIASGHQEALVLDLCDSDSIHAAVDQVLHRTSGQLYALFNNGAYGQPGAVEDLPRDVLREQFEVNLFGTHELTRSILPIMRAQGFGRIIQNSSVLGFVALKYRGAYNASKFALEGLTDTLRLELKGSGISVSLIEPGPIVTQFRKNAYHAFKTRIDPKGSPHQEAYRGLESRLISQDSVVAFSRPPEAVVKHLLHALESRNPRIRYTVTIPTHFFAVMKRLIPQNLLDKMLMKASH